MIAPEIYTGLNIPYRSQYIRSMHTSQEGKAREIIDVICSHFDLDKDKVFGQSRKRELVLARQLSMTFIREKTTLSLKEIGAMFDNRDHSTVIYAMQTIQDLIDTDRKFARTVAELEKMVAGFHKETVTTEIPTVETA